MIKEIILSGIKNPIFSGFGSVAIMGGIFYQLRQLPKILYRLTLRSFTVNFTVTNNDLTFDWIDLWLSSQSYAKKTKSLVLRASDIRESNNNKTEYFLSPGSGFHWFLWKGRILFLDRETEANANNKNSKLIEKIHIRTIGRSQSIIRDLVGEAKHIILQKEIVSVSVWRGWWQSVAGRRPRRLNSIILKNGQMDRILRDLAWFTGAREWYEARGVPYRRGYLFSGPPGTGKTSIVLAIAGHMNRPVCVLNLGSISNDNELFEAIGDAPHNSIILIEDIDCANSSGDRSKDDGEKDGISKAGLLNALDGVTTPDGRIVIMTTNFPDKLDNALIRPGRADVHEMFLFLIGEEQTIFASKFCEGEVFEPLDTPISPAVMQAAFMSNPGDCKAARDMMMNKDGK